MSKLQVMSVVGSAVPAPLRADGLLACWYVVSEGVAVSGDLTLSHGLEQGALGLG